MSTIAEFSIPAKDFALEETLDRVPDAEFEIERVAAHSEGRLTPFVWVYADDFDAFEAALADDPTVEDADCLSAFDDERFYRMDWVDSIHLLVHALLDAESTILSASGTDECWRLRILFPDREALSSTHDHCRSADIDFDIESIYELEGDRRGQFGLTQDQYDTLLAGIERGYYDVPREATLGEFAAALDISHQALSERLRRGHKNLIESTLVAGRAED